MLVSRMAINQWKQLCKRHANTSSNIVALKIDRACALGQVKYIYKNGNKVIRYHDLNILVAGDEAQVIWRDNTVPNVDVSDELKEMYDESGLFY